MQQLEEQVSTREVQKQDAVRSIGLEELALILWRNKVLVAASAVLFALLALAAAHIVRPRYEAKTVLLPMLSQTSGGSGAGLAGALSQLSSVASLAGLSVGGSASGRAETVATLGSEALTETYIRDHQLLPVLYSRKWDAERQVWRVSDKEDVPTLWLANDFFSHDIRTIVEDQKTGLITLTITWKNPAQAAEWANGLVTLTNTYLREKAISESERNIAYLDGAASKTNVIELRSAIYSLMESEIKKEMIARGNSEYALRVIDPAAIPERKTYPQTILWVSAGAFLGMALSALFLGIRGGGVPRSKIGNAV